MNSRWYEINSMVNVLFSLFEKADDEEKKSVISFMTQELINLRPYDKLDVASVFKMATGEQARNRWYDKDESVRIFVELLKNLSDDDKIGFLTKVNNKLS
ncbi:MAG: hypothetical protein PHX18_03750 [Candidatus Gastranaerophilales bacterium]|nr:hypothetical protein [Candidatus Gastranaerophilales bacterium]